MGNRQNGHAAISIQKIDFAVPISGMAGFQVIPTPD
jgi:hypothetical protein